MLPLGTSWIRSLAHVKAALERMETVDAALMAVEEASNGFLKAESALFVVF